MKYRIAMFAVAILAIVAAAPHASATVADLEAAQQANANLLFQYGFEGSDDTTRLADGSSNGYGLQRTAGVNGGDVNNIQFNAGWGGVGQSYQPESTADRQVGAGLLTSDNMVPLPAAVTVETVIQFDAYETPADTNGRYVLGARPAERAYFLRVYENANDGELTTTFGDSNGDRATVLDYNAGDWYYVALTASYDNGTNQTTANWYTANLTAGDTDFTGSGSEASGLFTGNWTGPGAVGVGNFSNGGQEYVHGRIDSIALTGEVLSREALLGRLDALNIPVPEPAAALLLGLAACSLSAVRRRRG